MVSIALHSSSRMELQVHVAKFILTTTSSRLSVRTFVFSLKTCKLILSSDGHRYGNLGRVSSTCGQRAKITNPANGKTVTVTFVDACPTCLNSNSIDLSVAAFKKIANTEQGLVPSAFIFSPCGVDRGLIRKYSRVDFCLSLILPS